MRSLSQVPSLEQSEERPAPSAPADDAAKNFSALVRAEFEWVWRVLRRIGLSEADADDATQQVFLVASRRSAEIRGSTRAFLYGTAVRVAANVRRTLRRRREVPDEARTLLEPSETELDELLEQRRARALLDALLQQMSPELRRVLVLSEIEQLSNPQIAELEAIPKGTVASRLRRARAEFYALLEREQQLQKEKLP